MMDPKRLWAKSKKDHETERPSMILPGHLEDVYHAALRVLAATADDQLAALGLDATQYRDRLRRVVLLAAAVHDLGKANDHFQGMIRRSRDVRVSPQGLRHEWVSILMLPHLREWLSGAVGGLTDFAIVEWAVAGHHPGHKHASPPKRSPPGSGVEIVLLMGHSDFRSALDWIKRTFGLGEPPLLTDKKYSLTGGTTALSVINGWYRQACPQWDQIKATPDQLLVAAAKNCLVAADVAGSALPVVWPNDPDRWIWIEKSFANRPEPGDLDAVVRLRLEKSKEHGGADADAEARKRFQDAVAASRSRLTYLKAGCGTGKTLAAYLWAAKNYPRRRLYFCYPTTGTATEGFRDYLFEPDSELGDIGAKLFHSRRDVDFEIILTTGKDTDAEEEDAAARLDSLEAWSTPIVACTVDTVLGLVQNNKRGLFAWPALAQSAFVFDEIHAFDDSLFGALLRFLRELPHLPVLLMTASLPAAREQALKEVFEGAGQVFEPIAGPVELENRSRYRKAEQVGNDPLPFVRETLAAGGKVLWVCNTVKRVMDAAARANELAPLIYHSRFKYQDRVGRHTEVIDAFKCPGAALAVCSQVAEMSLDLSADLLVTDLAPVPALIQRLGRLNRRAKDGDQTKPFLVVDPGDSSAPYTADDLEAARGWLARLPVDGISQRALAAAWEQTGDEPPAAAGSAWLDGGPVTTVKELREGSTGITVLMAEDRPRVRRQPKQLARLVLPMLAPPRSLDWRAWSKERGIPVAPLGAVSYDPRRGAEWNALRHH